MAPKSHHGPGGKKERGRTPGPSSLRPSRASSPVNDRHSPIASRPSSRDVTARNSMEGHDFDDHERQGRSTLAANLTNAINRAVTRGRPSSRPPSHPNSRPSSRSRPSSPVGERRRGLSTFPSTSNSHAPRSASAAPSLLPASPQMSPRDEDGGHSPRRPSIGRSESSQSQLSAGLRSMSIGPRVERRRSEQNVDGLGHPDDEDFGVNRARNGNQATRGRNGRGLGAGTGSVPPSVGKQRDKGERGSSMGWARFGRSVSRARGVGHAGAHDSGGAASPSLSRDRGKGPLHQQHLDSDEPQSPPPGLELEKGVHGFEFAFIIPAHSAEYTRSPFGRVRYIIKATAYGAGRAKSNVESWRDVFPVANPSIDGGPTPLTVLYNDLHPTVGLLSIACTSQNISVGGLFQLDIHSPTPPSDLVVYLVRISLETTIEIKTKRKGKQVIPAQRNKLFEKGYVPPRKEDPHGPGDGKKSDGSIRDPAKDGADSAWTVQGLARMPDDNSIRSSTIGGTKSAIRFSHQIVVEVVHSREPPPTASSRERKLKVFTLRQPITLPSCCVAFDAATLPAYTPANDDPGTAGRTVDGLPYDLAHLPNGARSSHATTPLREDGPSSSAGHGSGSGNATPGSSSEPTASGSSSANATASGSGASAWQPPHHRPNTAQVQRGTTHDYCVCGLSLQDLEARERALMMPPQLAAYDIPIDALRPHGKIGELPPPQSGGAGGSGSGGGVVGSVLGRSRTRSSSRSVSTRRGSSSSHRSVTLGGKRRSPSSGGSGATPGTLARSLSRRRGSASAAAGPSGSSQVGLVGGAAASRSSTRDSALSVSSSSSVGLAPIASGSGTSNGGRRGSSSRVNNDALADRGQQQQQRSASLAPPGIAEGEAPPSYDSAVLEEDEEAFFDEPAAGGARADDEQRGRRR